MSWEAYDGELRKIGILVNARNFLVFQGDVTAMAAKSPRELTEFFEQICGSDRFQEEYERCRVAVERAEGQVCFFSVEI